MTLIDAEKLIDAICEKAFEMDEEDVEWRSDSGFWMRYKAIEKIINNQPVVEPQEM